MNRFPSEVQALAIDSAFVSMWDTGLEIADKKVSLPTFIIKGMLEYVRRQIKQNAGYDMDDVNTIKEIQKCHMPVIFIVSKEDKLVSYQNSVKLYEKYPANSKKRILYVKGDHNECRSLEEISNIADFLANTITKNNLNIMSHNKENLCGIQIDKSNYNTPNPRDEQKQQNIIKLIQSQQQQFQNKATTSPSHSVNINQLLQSKNMIVSSERPASHSISYQTSSQINQNQSFPHYQVSYHNKSVIIGNNQQNSNPILNNLTPQNNNFGVNDKKSLHCYSTSNIIQDNCKQDPIIGDLDKNYPTIDQKDIEENPLIQSLLKDLIQKTYEQTPSEQTQKDIIQYELNQTEQSPQSIFLSAQQQIKSNLQKDMNFTSSINEFDVEGQNTLNKNIQILYEQPQEENNQEINDKVNLNQNKSQSSLDENTSELLDTSEQQSTLNRKSSIVSPTTLDLKGSNIPDEMHEIDFPKIKDFRTKAKINNYTFQVNPPGGTFQNQTVGIGDLQVFPSPLNDPSRKTSISGNIYNNPHSLSYLNTSIFKYEQINIQAINQTNCTTANNSSQFFSEKSTNSPKNISSSCTNKHLSQALLEDSIYIPQSDNLTYNSVQHQQLHQLQYQQQLQKNNKQTPQLLKSQQIGEQQSKQLLNYSVNNHSRKSSILKASQIMNTQEEDINHLPQSTLNINLKQRQRNQSELTTINPPPQTERQNINDSLLRKQQLDIQSRKLTLDALIQKPGNCVINKKYNFNNNEQESEQEQCTTNTNISRTEGRSAFSNHIKQKCMNHSNLQSATIVRSNNSQDLEGSQDFQQYNQQNFIKEINVLNQQDNKQFTDIHLQQQQIKQQQGLQAQSQQSKLSSFSLNEDQKEIIQQQQQQLKQQLLPLVIQQQQVMQQQKISQLKQSSDIQLGQKYKREVSKEKSRILTEQTSIQQDDIQNTQIQKNNYFVSIGKQNQKDDKAIEDNSYQKEKNGISNENNINNLSQTLQSHKEKYIQQYPSPQIYSPNYGLDNTSFCQIKKNHQPKHSHVFRYKIDFDNILIKNNGCNTSINKENDYQKQSVSTSLIFHNQQQSYSHDKDSRLNSTHINPTTNSPSQININDKQKNSQSIIINEKNEMMKNQQSKSFQNSVEQQLPFQSQNQQQQNQSYLAQSPLVSLNRNLGGKILSNSQLHKVNSPSQQNIYQTQNINKNTNDPMSTSKGYDNINIQKVNESLNISKMNTSTNILKGNDINKTKNSKLIKENQTLLTEGSLSSKNTVYTNVNLNISQQYAKASISVSSNQNLQSKQTPNEFKNLTYSNNTLVQEQKLNSSLNQQFSVTNNNKIQNNTLNFNKIYAPSPTQHAKHRVLQKCAKDQQQINIQPSTKVSTLSDINNISTGNNKDNNYAISVLTSEDFNKKKLDMLSQIQKNRNDSIHLIPEYQGGNYTIQLNEEQNQNKNSSKGNEQKDVHKNRFHNNKEKSDSINFKLNSTTQSSHSPIIIQNQRYAINEDLNSSNIVKNQSSSLQNIPNFFQYKSSKYNYVSSALNSIDYQKSKNQRSNPQSLSPNQSLTNTNTTSQKFAFKNRVNQATKIVQIQLGDKRQVEQNSFDNHASSINNSNILHQHSQSPNQILILKH